MNTNKFKIRLVFSCVILTVTAFFLFIFSFFNQPDSAVAFSQENYVRLHVLANSNQPKDQDLKLTVRDAVLAETMNLLQDVTSQDEAKVRLNTAKLAIQKHAQDTVFEQGFDYPVEVEIGNFSFPERQYGSLVLPEGDYDAVRVKIGQAKGNNWWCVLFPPLCLADLDDSTTGMVEINPGHSEKRLALRFKLWEQVAETQYVQRLQKWWQASAATYPAFQD